MSDKSLNSDSSRSPSTMINTSFSLLEKGGVLTNSDNAPQSNIALEEELQDHLNTTLHDFGCGSDCPEQMALYMQILITIGYTTIVVVAVGGNLTVCYVVFAYQRLRTVTNYFIVNLAISDILMAVICIPFTFIANLLIGYWPFGAAMCPLVHYLQVVTVLLSAFTLVAISLDRFVAIICPLRQKLTARQACVVIIAIWVLSLLVPLPVAVLSRMHYRPDVLSGEVLPFCEEVWGESGELRYLYSLILMVSQYFLPLFVLAVTYTWIGVVIWGKKPPGEAETNRDQRFANSKRKMVKMMITVVIIYGVCWLPLHTITLVGDAHGDIWLYKYIQVVWIGCHWLAMSNCCYNPMVYCWMNSRFRIGFKHVFRFCPCIKQEDLNETNSRNVKWNYTCVYTMNLNENGSYQRRIHRYTRSRDLSSSDSRQGNEHLQLHNVIRQNTNDKENALNSANNNHKHRFC